MLNTMITAAKKGLNQFRLTDLGLQIGIAINLTNLALAIRLFSDNTSNVIGEFQTAQSPRRQL